MFLRNDTNKHFFNQRDFWKNILWINTNILKYVSQAGREESGPEFGSYFFKEMSNLNWYKHSNIYFCETWAIVKVPEWMVHFLNANAIGFFIDVKLFWSHAKLQRNLIWRSAFFNQTQLLCNISKVNVGKNKLKDFNVKLKVTFYQKLLENDCILAYLTVQTTSCHFRLICYFAWNNFISLAIYNSAQWTCFCAVFLWCSAYKRSCKKLRAIFFQQMHEFIISIFEATHATQSRIMSS